jgi:hypothetical protein
MRSLMKLAKEKQTQGMVPLCDEMIKKVIHIPTLLTFKISQQNYK